MGEMKAALPARSFIRRWWPLALPHLYYPVVIAVCVCAYVHLALSVCGTRATAEINILFGADASRVIDDMTCPEGNHFRTKMHPLFVLLTCPTGTALSGAIPNKALVGGMIVVAIGAATLVVFALTLHALGIPHARGVIYVALLGSSGAFLTWSAIPETHMLGGLGVMLACYLVASRRHPLLLVPAGLIAGGAALPNLAPWLTLAWLRTPSLRRVVALCALTITTLTLLALLQRHIYPSATLWFMPDTYAKDYRYFVWQDETVFWLARPFKVLSYFAVWPLALPGIESKLHPLGPRMIFVLREQLSPTFLIGLAFWFIAFLGLRRTVCPHRSLVVALSIGLTPQYAFFLLYSTETFLFAGAWIGQVALLLALLLEASPSRLVSWALVSLIVAQFIVNWHGLQSALASL